MSATRQQTMDAARVILGPRVFDAMMEAHSISPISVLEAAVRTAFYGDPPKDGVVSPLDWMNAQEILRDGMRRLHKEGKLE